MAKAQINLGIETGDTSLKLALYDLKAKTVLRTDILPISQFPLDVPAVYENTLSGWLHENGYTKIHSVSLAIPAVRGVVRDIQIPADVDDLDSYISWDLTNSLSMSLDAYYFDYELLPDEKTPVSAVVAAFPKLWIDNLRTGVHKKELMPSVVEPELFSLFNLLEFAEGMGSDVHCVLKADRTGVWAAFGNAHGISTLRWLSTGALGIDPDDVVYPQLAESLAESLQEGFAMYPDALKKVRVCGELAVEPGFFEALTHAVQNIELVLWDSFLKLSLTADGNFPRTVIQCTGAIGAALRFTGDRK